MFNAAEDASIAALNERIDNLPDSPFDKEVDYSTDMNETQDNFRFIQRLQKKPIPKGTYTKQVFGCQPFDINDILMDNIWNRSILTTDKICREFLGWNIEQMQKYQKGKRKLGFDSWWLLILLGGGGLVVLLMVFLFMSGSSGGASAGALGGMMP